MNLEYDLPTAIQRWKNGDIVWSAEMGGIGPGYEQAIQMLLWEILARWKGGPIKPVEGAKSYPEDYTKHVDEVVSELDKQYGFSGAQVGAAKGVAYQFMAYGYQEMMAKLPDERWIQVTKHFPGSAH